MRRSVLALSIIILAVAVVSVSAYAYAVYATPYTGPSSTGIDYTSYGFPAVLASQTFTPGTPATVSYGPYVVSIPANAFSSQVKFDLLAGDPATFAANAPAGEMPVLAYAFRVTDMSTGQLVGNFNAPVTVTISNPSITSQSNYYNANMNGGYTLNPTGMQVSSGQLVHPESTALVGWIVTSPSTVTPPASEIPNYAEYGFQTVVASRIVTPGTQTIIAYSTYTVTIPSNAFSNPVKFEILTGDPQQFASGAPAGQKPVIAFAFRVTDLNTGQLVGTFNAPVTMMVTDPSITTASQYYNINEDHAYSLNSNGLQASSGALTHPVSGAMVGWVITSPLGQIVTYSSVPDFTMYGFANVAASQDVTPGSSSSIYYGPYTVIIPTNAFSDPVRFDFLTGDASNFASNAPAGITPNFAFAFRVTDLSTGKLVGTFNAPVTVYVNSYTINSQSIYYNTDTNGMYTVNPAGLQLSNGQLIHPESSALAGWVVGQPIYSSGSSSYYGGGGSMGGGGSYGGGGY